MLEDSGFIYLHIYIYNLTILDQYEGLKKGMILIILIHPLLRVDESRNPFLPSIYNPEKEKEMKFELPMDVLVLIINQPFCIRCE